VLCFRRRRTVLQPPLRCDRGPEPADECACGRLSRLYLIVWVRMVQWRCARGGTLRSPGRVGRTGGDNPGLLGGSSSAKSVRRRPKDSQGLFVRWSQCAGLGRRAQLCFRKRAMRPKGGQVQEGPSVSTRRSPFRGYVSSQSQDLPRGRLVRDSQAVQSWTPSGALVSDTDRVDIIRHVAEEVFEGSSRRA
jgi:hypothetical protein